MAKLENIDEEREIDIPGDADENVGEGAPKKKAKRKKSKEERAAERKIVFWTLLIVVLVTLIFWFIPVIGKIKMGLPVFEQKEKGVMQEIKTPEKNESKNYVEITL